MAAAKAKPFRDAMFLFVVRTRLANRLVSEQGYSRAEARDAASHLTDAFIEEAATSVSATSEAVPTVGAGGFLVFLLAFIQSPLFSQLIEILLGLFAAPQSQTTPLA